MPLNAQDVAARCKELYELRQSEKPHLDQIYSYWRGKQPLPMVPVGTPPEVRQLAKISRINMVKLPVEVAAQSMYVVGYKPARATDQDPLWDVFQKNRLDAGQLGVHRSALAYGAAYVGVLPGMLRGERVPVVKGLSPRKLTAAYEPDGDYPEYALELRDKKGERWRLWDAEAVYDVALDPDPMTGGWKLLDGEENVSAHGMGICPVVRFLNVHDLEDEVNGEIEPLMSLQDQIDVTTFEMLVVQHFQAWKLRYILGWMAKDELELAKTSAARFLTLDVNPDEVKIGEFEQASPQGFLDSRSAAFEHLATISQTPPHHLLGKLVNLSAEALVAAESGQRRKIDERQTSFGESWEDVFSLCAILTRAEIDPTAQVRWKDTEARALSATVDALGKMAQMLGVPVEVLWPLIPGWTDQDVAAAKAAAREADPMASVIADLERQFTVPPATPPAGAGPVELDPGQGRAPTRQMLGLNGS